MLTEGLYRDKNGRTAFVRTTATGYLISYSDGPTITLPLPDTAQLALDRPPSTSRTRQLAGRRTVRNTRHTDQ